MSVAFFRTVSRALVCYLLLAIPCTAQTSSDFTFKRVKPPQAGAKKRIDIQVEKTWPYEDPAKPEKPSAPAAADTGDTTEAWFWAAISADIAQADPARMAEAVTALNREPAARARFEPDANALDTILKRFGTDILLATADKRVSPAFVMAVMAVESAGKPQAKSPKGAQGLMQLIPATAERFGVEDPYDPAQNIKGGAAYLDWLLAEFKGDPILALAGYNAGENAVKKNGGVPPYAETRAYVPKVIAAWEKTRLYCLSLPRFADDGCVLALDRSLSR